MRRILIGPFVYLRGLARDAVRGWDAFFFTPADPTPLGVIRLVLGVLLFWNLVVYGMDLRAYFGPGSWAAPETVRRLAQERLPGTWSLWFSVPESLLVPVWLACLGVLALFAAGLFSRVTAVLAWVIVVSTVRRSPASLFGFDQISSTLALYLAVSGASGQAVSLDRFLGRWRQARAEAASRRRDGRWTLPPGRPEPTVGANLGLRLIQLHMCLMYGAAGLTKLTGPAWWDGSALWGVIANTEFRRFDLTWLADWPNLISVMTYSGLAAELLYPFLVWNRRLRPLVLTIMVSMHLGIDLLLGLTEFGIAMVCGNLAFISGLSLRELVTGPAAGPPAGRLLYDGACPRCRASMALATAADPDRLVEPVDLTAVDVATIDPRLTKSGCLTAMHLVRADGRIAVGYDAVVTLARWLPLFWPAGLIGSLPGVAGLGRRAYARLAATRRREGGCSDATCGLHPNAARRPVSESAPAASAPPARSSR